MRAFVSNSSSSLRRGFTMVELMVATSLLSGALLLVFGYHARAVKTNMHARKLTDCTYLAQSRLERLLTLPWTADSRPNDLKDSMGADPTSSSDPMAYLEFPNSQAQPNAINAMNGPQVKYGPKSFYVTWDIEDMNSPATMIRIRVRCQYYDNEFDQWKGTTIASYRFRDK